MKLKVRKRILKRLQKKVFDFGHPVDLNKVVLSIGKHERAIRAYRSYCLTWDRDQRTGEETYGYFSLDSIQSNLEYMCDRWRCSFRLTWLLGVPEAVTKLKSEQ